LKDVVLDENQVQRILAVTGTLIVAQTNNGFAVFDHEGNASKDFQPGTDHTTLPINCQPSKDKKKLALLYKDQVMVTSKGGKPIYANSNSSTASYTFEKTDPKWISWIGNDEFVVHFEDGNSEKHLIK
ncbi:MAG: hypothetical protein AAF320_04650, partial [Myxococcota bacterium]